MGIYEGYLQLGGAEIANVARFRQYIGNNPTFPWKKDIPADEAEALRVALGDAPYTTPAADDAPWYDGGVPASANFWGIYITDVQGDEDDTRENSTTQSVGDGGNVGRTRRATRQMRFKAIMAARDDLAMEAGLQWLNRALDPDDCGGDCGAQTLCSYAAIPGFLDTCDGVPYSTAVVQTNDVQDPNVVTGTPYWSAPNATLVSGFTAMSNYLATADQSSGSAFFFTNLAIPASPGEVISARMTVTNNTAGALPFAIQLASYSTSGTQTTKTGPSTVIPAGATVDLIVENFVLPAGTTGYRPILRNNAVLPTGTRLNITRVLSMRGATVADFFSGDTPNTPTASYTWTGLQNASPSRKFLAGTNPERHLNEVTAISGVTVNQKHKIKSGVIREVEFGLEAGTPWFFQTARPAIDAVATSAALSTYFDAGKLVAVNHVFDARVKSIATTRTQFNTGSGTTTAQDNQATTAGIPQFAQPDNRMTKIAVTGTTGWVDHGPGRTDASGLPATLRPVTPGRQYTGSVFATANGAGQLILRANWFDANGNDMGSSVAAAAQTIDGDPNPVFALIKRYYVTGICPAGASYMILTARMSGPGGTTAPSGATFWINWWQIEETKAIVGQPFGSPSEWFDGESTDTFFDDFQRQGAANASASFHFLKWLCDYEIFNGRIYQPGYSPLLDPLCPPPPAPPALPTIAACVPLPGLTGWNRSFYTLPPIEAPENGISVPTVTLGVQSNGVTWQYTRQIRVRFYANPQNLAPADIDPCSFCAEFTVSYVDESTSFVVDGEVKRTTAIINGTPGYPADSYLYGENGGPIEWPELACGVPHIMTVDTPRSVSSAVTVKVDLTRRM